MFAPGEAAQLREICHVDFRVGRNDGDDLEARSGEPWPDAVGGHRGRPFAQERQADSGDGRDHGHANFPRVDDNKDVLAPFRKYGGDPGRSFGWGSIHELLG